MRLRRLTIELYRKTTHSNNTTIAPKIIYRKFIFFDLKIKIPLIALPVFLVVVSGTMQAIFSFGRSVEKKETAAIPTPTPVVIIKPTLPPKPILVSKLGTVKATYQVQSLLVQSSPTLTSVTSINNDQVSTLSPTLISPTYTPTPTPTPSRYVLVTGSTVTFLITPSTFSLNSYLNQRVLVTGLFDSARNALTIEKNADIELMP